MQVSHVEKIMVEQSSTVPNSQSIRSTLGLILSNPGLVVLDIYPGGALLLDVGSSLGHCLVAAHGLHHSVTLGADLCPEGCLI